MGRLHDHRDIDVGLPHACEHAESVEIRHDKVEHDPVDAHGLGSGQQFMPWIHVDDWCALVVWLIEHEQAIGAFNATAPEPVTNRVFGQTLARVLHRPAVVPTPAFVLQLVLGELATALLTGQRAVPAHAEQLGFRFTYRSLEPALRSLSL